MAEDNNISSEAPTAHLPQVITGELDIGSVADVSGAAAVAGAVQRLDPAAAALQGVSYGDLPQEDDDEWDDEEGNHETNERALYDRQLDRLLFWVDWHPG